jgi:hypothetical protein
MLGHKICSKDVETKGAVEKTNKPPASGVEGKRPRCNAVVEVALAILRKEEDLGDMAG